jgi:hypothetical protein
MRTTSLGLVTASVTAGSLGAVTPEVPWWGQLLMALVATALAYFGGRTSET